MVIKPSKFELKKSPMSIEDLYKEGQMIPAVLYDHINKLFDAPAYSKKFNRKRTVAHKLDQSLKRYLSGKKIHVTPNYLLFHKPKLKEADIRAFYNTTKKLLKKTTHVIFHLTLLQFEAIKSFFDIYTYHVGEQLMMYWHGNQTLTGAPAVFGGNPRVEYFQWGNLYGIVKYHKVLGEDTHIGSLLIYFESRREKDFKTCLNELAVRLQQNTQSIASRLNPGMIQPKESENKL